MKSNPKICLLALLTLATLHSPFSTAFGQGNVTAAATNTAASKDAEKSKLERVVSNIEYCWYQSGHMVYAHEASLKELHDNVAAFIRKTDNLEPKMSYEK